MRLRYLTYEMPHDNLILYKNFPTALSSRYTFLHSYFSFFFIEFFIRARKAFHRCHFLPVRGKA